MANALVRADVMQPLDAETLGEGAAGTMRLGSLNGRGRNQMVEHDDDLVWIVDLEDLAPTFRQKGHVHQHGGRHIDHGDVAGLDRAAAACARQDLLCHGHTHAGRSPLRSLPGEHAA